MIGERCTTGVTDCDRQDIGAGNGLGETANYSLRLSVGRELALKTNQSIMRTGTEGIAIALQRFSITPGVLFRHPAETAC